MTELTIVANIHAKPDQTGLVKTELLKLIPVTRKEPGCLRYDLHLDNDDPAHFMFYETWESRGLWQDHINAPHLADYKAATEGAIAEFTLSEMSLIG
ncbi:putative quinol monooxygenase [Roseibium marinum]|uniref:Quinol monooxygenase YgiN n=1 Tax=Roseibium marinum TaxID=281252 RepID=A0A2S3V0W0_9HYPH|nr:putative quinol monooxygenase [Roseibium marinum]POF33612.1 quinol monooxygenase YgiN [Roseibium marinum]